MAARKTERQMNLTIVLLEARGFLTKHQIRERVEGYAGLSDGAFERTFERDKDDVRRYGMEISTGQNAEWAGDEIGYRILRSEFELPPVALTAEEAAVVALASRAWDQNTLAGSTATAVRKLSLDAETGSAELHLDPMVTVPEDVFNPFVDALNNRTQVRFDYRNSRGEVAERTLEPWGLNQVKGSWYIIGRDLDRDERRTFKLDRVLGTPKIKRPVRRFTLPDDLDLTAIWAELARQPTRTAVVALRPDTEASLHRRGRPTDHPRPEGVPPDWTLVEVPYSYEPGLIGELAAAAGNVVVLDPADLRERVLERLAGVAR
ncbi:helix-turn-helix transcriptional regulator [Enemella sp. A6]|uniref:helix-turn-helix transcriptional regulator n=1 Tax=Enemella sp. A6 TaxID=3440152 RepID=UPI003EBB4789